MIKKISLVVLTFIITSMMCITAFAAPDLPRLVDDANLLSESEYNDVLARLDKVSDEYGLNIAIVTVNGTDGKDIRDFADDFYDQHYISDNLVQTSQGEKYEPVPGVLLVLDMDQREWWLSTYGEGAAAFTDYGIEEFNNDVFSYFRTGDFADAFMLFADTADRYISAERAGEPIDVPQYEKKPVTAVGWIIRIVIGLGIGFGLSFAVTGTMKKKMLTVNAVTNADDYIVPDKSELTKSRDNYLYHNVVAVPIPKDQNSKGGSSMHFSSGGFSHGGGGGRF